MTIDIDDILKCYLDKYVNKYSDERIESINNMLDEFEMNNIISPERREYYSKILNYCNEIDSKYKK